MANEPERQCHASCTVSQWENTDDTENVRVHYDVVAFPDGTWISFHGKPEVAFMVANATKRAIIKAINASNKCIDCNGTMIRESVCADCRVERNKR
jgi:hypothetical protein